MLLTKRDQHIVRQAICLAEGMRSYHERRRDSVFPFPPFQSITLTFLARDQMSVSDTPSSGITFNDTGETNIAGDMLGRDKASATTTGQGNVVVQGSNNAVNLTIQEGLQTLTRLLEQSPEARRVLNKYGDTIDVVSSQIKKLGDYKGLHDDLHEIQFGCYDLIEDYAFAELKRAANRRVVENALELLTERLTDAQVRAARLPFRPRELDWLNYLSEAHAHLQATLSLAPDPEIFEIAKDALLRALDCGPGRVDQALFALAKNLPLSALTDALQHVAPALGHIPAQTFNVRIFELCLAELQHMDRRLTDLCYAHTDWQDLINRVRPFEVRLYAATAPVKAEWAALRADTKRLCDVANPPLTILLEQAEGLVIRVSGCCAEIEQAPANDSEALREQFVEYRRRVGLLFKRIDDNLKAACDQLVKTATEPLDKLKQQLMS